MTIEPFSELDIGRRVKRVVGSQVLHGYLVHKAHDGTARVNLVVPLSGLSTPFRAEELEWVDDKRQQFTGIVAALWTAVEAAEGAAPDGLSKCPVCGADEYDEHERACLYDAVKTILTEVTP